MAIKNIVQQLPLTTVISAYSLNPYHTIMPCRPLHAKNAPTNPHSSQVPLAWAWPQVAVFWGAAAPASAGVRSRRFGASPASAGVRTGQFGPAPASAGTRSRQYGPAPASAGIRYNQRGAPPSSAGARPPQTNTCFFD